MLEEHKDQIKWLRSQGLGYKKIATSLELTRDQVRGYCRKCGLAGYTEKTNSDKLKEVQDDLVYKLCLQCGKKLKQEGRGRRRKYCNVNCKREWEKKNKKTHTFTCQYCGKEYTTTKATGSKFCSMECSTRYRFYRKEDTKEVIDKILANEKVERIPQWLKELLLSDK